MNITNRAWAELFLLSAIWGGTFFTVAIALRELAPFTAVLYRVGFGAALLWLVVLARRLPVPRDPGFWGACLVMGLLNNAIPFTLFTLAQTAVESGLVAILNATTAFFGAVVAAALIREERLTARRFAGVLLGVAGVAAIIGWEALATLDIRSLAQLACIGAAISYAFASVWARVNLSGQSPTMSAAGMLSGSTLLMAPVALAVDGAPKLELSWQVWASVGYYAIFATAFAYLLYYRVIRMAGAANTMLCTILIIPIAVLLGWAFLGERLSPSAFVGFALITLGLLVLDGRAFRYAAARLAPR